MVQEDYIKNGKDFYYKNEYEEALENFNKAIELNNEYAEAYSCRGTVHYNLKKYKEALADYNKAIELDNEYVKAYNGRGLVYWKLEKYKEALADYNKAIELNAEYAEAYNGRGSVYWKLEKYEEALADYNRAIELNTEYAEAYNGRGLVYWKLEKYKEALADYKEALKTTPKPASVYNNMANVYCLLKQYNKAEKYYNKAIELNSELDAYKIIFKNRSILHKNSKNVKYTEHSEYIKYDDIIIKILEENLFDRTFYNYVESEIEDIEKKSLIYNLFLMVGKIKKEMTADNKVMVGHYTKTENLKFLFKPNTAKLEEDKKPKLRLNNVAYMNDPTEGQVFLKLLDKYCDDDKKEYIKSLYKSNIEDSNGRDILSGKNHTYLLSLSTAIDTSLPMWVQYSKNGEGCCLVFKEKFFDTEENITMDMPKEDLVGELAIKEEEKKQNYCLYKVRYIKCIADSYQLDEADKDLAELINKITQCLYKFKKYKDKNDAEYKEIHNLIRNILDQVRYLFKDYNYSHEDEVRIIKFESNGNVKYTGDAEGFIVPHTYVNMEKDLKIKEVILGPKVNNATEIANYLYYTGCVERVSKSKIKYQ